MDKWWGCNGAAAKELDQSFLLPMRMGSKDRSLSAALDGAHNLVYVCAFKRSVVLADLHF